MRSFTVFIAAVLIAATGFGGVINQVGTYTNWATSWTAIGNYDADENLTENLDFVGNAANPGLYYNNNGSYVMFRMRIDADTFTTSAGSYLLLIDAANYGVTGIDYAFAWDAKMGTNPKHMLEMCIAGQNGPTWGQANLADIDNKPSEKTEVDINGAGRTTDGYVRSTDEQWTTSFGNTTFIDFAVKWSYLETYTNLRSNQTWSIALVSIKNATDHAAFGEDFGGGIKSTDDISIGWSAPIAIPEPTVIGLLATSGIGLLIGRRLIDPKLRKAFFG